MQLQWSSLLVTLAAVCVTIGVSSASPVYYEKRPRADPMPNDIYKDLVNHEPQLERDARLLYKNLGPLRYYVQDPEQADYLIVDRETRLPNEVSNKEVAAAGPIGIPPPSGFDSRHHQVEVTHSGLGVTSTDANGQVSYG